MSDKLPEWPELPTSTEPAAYTAYWGQQARAALARMEALVEYAQHAPSCGIGGKIGGFPTPCDCGLDELLAACERRKS